MRPQGRRIKQHTVGLNRAFVDRQVFAKLAFHIGDDLTECVLNNFLRFDQLIPEDQLTITQAVADTCIDLVRRAVVEW